MADVSVLDFNGEARNVKDASARSKVDAVIIAQEYDRQQLTDTYGGRSIASIFAGEIGSQNVWTWLQKRVKAGNFAGLRIGDYIDVQVKEGANVATQTVRYVIAAIDPYFQCGDAAMGHHIVMMPKATVAVKGDKAVNGSYIKWKDTADNNGTADAKCPYLSSLLHDWEINDYLHSLPAEVQAVIKAHRMLLEERYSSSGKLTEPSGWAWQDLGKIWSPSEVEVYGFNVWSKPGYGTGCDCQFPIFKQTKDRIMGGRVTWWLRSVSGSSSSGVCYVSYTGIAYCNSPTIDWVRPRPCFLVG